MGTVTGLIIRLWSWNSVFGIVTGLIITIWRWDNVVDIVTGLITKVQSWDNVVGISTRPRNRRFLVATPLKIRVVSLLHIVQKVSGAT